MSPEGVPSKDVLKNLAKLTEKHLSWVFFFNNNADLRPAAATLSKERVRHWCFPVNFAKFFKILFSM